MYFIAKYDTDLLSKEKALGEKRPVILQLLRKCSGNPQNTASLRLKSRLAEKTISAPDVLYQDVIVQDVMSYMRLP